MIIVDAESAARDALEHVVMATRAERRPIVLFTNDEDTTHVKDAVAAGVTAYIVAGLAPERIRPILDVAMARFQHEQELRRELADARCELQRAQGDRPRQGPADAAPGPVGEQRPTRSCARPRWTRTSRLGEVAQRMLDVADLLG